MEGTHVELGVEMAKRYHESPEVIHCIAAHYNDIEPQTVEAVLIQAADAISAARPGARRESIENYIRRLEKLEEISNSFPGVEKSFAIQSGREVRIMVKPEDISDEGTYVLAREIAKRIENELELSLIHILMDCDARRRAMRSKNMKTVTIRLTMMTDNVKNFVSLVNRYPYDMDLRSGRYVAVSYTHLFLSLPSCRSSIRSFTRKGTEKSERALTE